MGRGIALRVGYGLEVYSEDDGWLVKEVTEDYDFDHVVPWMQCVDTDTGDSLRQHLLRYLLHNLPEDPPDDQILTWSETDLNDFLEAHTGLRVETFGWEWDRIAVIAPMSKVFYGLKSVTLTPDMWQVTDEQKRQIAWVIDALRSNLNDAPGLKILVSYG